MRSLLNSLPNNNNNNNNMSKIAFYGFPWYSNYKIFNIIIKNLRRPGVEPGSTAWKATMLTVTPPIRDGYLYHHARSGHSHAIRYTTDAHG